MHGHMAMGRYHAPQLSCREASTTRRRCSNACWPCRCAMLLLLLLQKVLAKYFTDTVQYDDSLLSLKLLLEAEHVLELFQPLPPVR